jgi:hypothetical protein
MNNRILKSTAQVIAHQIGDTLTTVENSAVIDAQQRPPFYKGPY